MKDLTTIHHALSSVLIVLSNIQWMWSHHFIIHPLEVLIYDVFELLIVIYKLQLIVLCCRKSCRNLVPVYFRCAWSFIQVDMRYVIFVELVTIPLFSSFWKMDPFILFYNADRSSSLLMASGGLIPYAQLFTTMDMIIIF